MSSDLFDDWEALHTVTIHADVAGDGWNGETSGSATSTGMLDARVVTLARASDGASVMSSAQFFTDLDQLSKFPEGATVDITGELTKTVVGVAVTDIGDPDLDGIQVMLS